MMMKRNDPDSPSANRGPLLALAGGLLVGFVFGACDETPFDVPRDEDAPIQTDRLAYELERNGDVLETSISYEYRNTGSTPLFIQNCNGAAAIQLEKRVGGQWTVVWGNVVPECISEAIAILPGESISATLEVAAGAPLCQCGQPPFSVSEIEGVYRLVFSEVFDSQDGNGFATGERVPNERRRSNRFTLDD